jgi:hypothetical protein
MVFGVTAAAGMIIVPTEWILLLCKGSLCTNGDLQRTLFDSKDDDPPTRFVTGFSFLTILPVRAEFSPY